MSRGGSRAPARRLSGALAAALAAWFVLAPAPSAAQNHNCAAAVGVGPNRMWGNAYRQPWETTALQVAQQNCRGQCSFLRAFSHGCMAVATAEGYAGHRWVYGWAQDADRNVAIARALQFCEQEKRKDPATWTPIRMRDGRLIAWPCYIRVWACGCTRPAPPPVQSGTCIWHRGFNNQVGCYCWQGRPDFGGHLVGPVDARRCPRG